MKFSALLTVSTLLSASTLAKSTTTTTTCSSTYSVPSPAKTEGFNETMYEEFETYKPLFMIINMFELEEEPFLEHFDLIHNFTIPGLSPIYPYIHCNANHTLCQVTTGEGEINAATTLTSLALNPSLDLTETFFMVAGIAGASPKEATLGDVTFAHFAIQILEYEVDSREMPANWTTGYFPFGTTSSSQYPGNIYGTEVFELNENLRDRALELAQTAELYNGTEANEEFRELYDYEPANRMPQAIACDTLTSDTYWFGQDFDETFTNYTKLITNDTATYCTTQQEDNATLEALMRAAMYGLVDFSRIVVMRSVSDFTYADYYTDLDETTYLFNDVSQGGIEASLVNLVYAGEPFIMDVLENFETYNNGTYINDNYIGDFFNSLEEDVEIRSWATSEWGTA